MFTNLGIISIGTASDGTMSANTIGPVPSSNNPLPLLDPSPTTCDTLDQI